jgi:hypothetical protein
MKNLIAEDEKKRKKRGIVARNNLMILKSCRKRKTKLLGL